MALRAAAASSSQPAWPAGSPILIVESLLHMTLSQVQGLPMAARGLQAAAVVCACGGGDERCAQAKVSAISALNQMFICSNWSLLQPTDAADEPATGFIALATGSYWNSAVSQDAWIRVMVE